MKRPPEKRYDCKLLNNEKLIFIDKSKYKSYKHFISFII